MISYVEFQIFPSPDPHEMGQPPPTPTVKHRDQTPSRPGHRLSARPHPPMLNTNLCQWCY